MVDYPIDVVRQSDVEFVATWVDFPALPAAMSDTPQGAFQALLDATFGAVADLVARGLGPNPSPANGRATVSIGDATLLSPHIGNLVNLTKKGTWMLTYAWSNDSAYIE